MKGRQKQEFGEKKVGKNRTGTKLGQIRDNKWTEGGQIVDKRLKEDKKWDPHIDIQHRIMQVKTKTRLTYL